MFSDVCITNFYKSSSHIQPYEVRLHDICKCTSQQHQPYEVRLHDICKCTSQHIIVKIFWGMSKVMIGEVDKIDEYSQIDLSQNNYNLNLTPNRSRELTNVNRILHHTFQTPAKIF